MKRIALGLILIAAIPLAGCKSGTTSTPGPAAGLKTEQDKTLYALGLILGGNLGPLALSPQELEIVNQGISDAASSRKPQVDLQTYAPKVQELARARAGAGAAAEKKKSEVFLDGAAKEAGAVKSASGLIYRTLKPGAGASPTAADTVKVHYEGTLIDGSVFDSSLKRGQPVEFPLSNVIPCWTEGVQKMKVGEKAKLICPSAIAYGDQGHPPVIPGGATLIFEVELLEILKK